MTTDPLADNRCPICNSPDICWKDEYQLGWYCRLCGASFKRPVAQPKSTKINMRKTIAILLAAIPLLLAAPVQAGCGWLDPTCDSGPGDCLFGSCPSGGSSGGAEIQVVTPPTYYQFEIRNGTQSTIRFLINNDLYTLHPGYRQSYRYLRTSGSSSGGSAGERYYATIYWDGDFAAGSQNRSFTLPSSPDSWYEFRTSGSAIYLY